MRPVDIVNLPRFDMPPPEARVSDNVHPFFKIAVPESNENPHLPPVDPEYPEHVRYSDFRNTTRPPRRGFIALFRNPAQFWQSDSFLSGHVMNGSLGATYTRPGSGSMRPDQTYRRNLSVPPSTSYGNLVDITNANVGGI